MSFANFPVPALVPALEWAAAIYREVRLNGVREQDWAGDEHTVGTRGSWFGTPVYAGNTIGKERRRKPRPTVLRDGGREKRRAFFESVRTLPERVPEAHRLFSSIPCVNFVALTRMGPHTHIPPHAHVNPDSAVLQIGVQIPRGGLCGTRCVGTTKLWMREGDWAIFLDRLDHEAWNGSRHHRTLLHVDFDLADCGMRPEKLVDMLTDFR